MNKAFFSSLIVAACMTIYSAVQISVELHERAVAQDLATNTMLTWDRAYQSLTSSEKRWEASIPKMGNFSDLASLVTKTDLAPLAWPSLEKLSIESVDVLDHLRAYKACLSDGSAGVLFQANSIEEAFSALAQFGKRKDVYFDGVSVDSQNSNATIRFAKFCLILRG